MDFEIYGARVMSDSQGKMNYWQYLTAASGFLKDKCVGGHRKRVTSFKNGNDYKMPEILE